MVEKWLNYSDVIPSLYRKGIHGKEHAKRVLQLSQSLASLENLSTEHREIIEFCAIFHDIGRINDFVDNLHGQRSIEKLQKYDFFGLELRNKIFVEYIIKNHCIDDQTAYSNALEYGFSDINMAIYLLKYFKDCDNLDRFRIFGFNESYLRLENSHQLIAFAKKINGY
jgi:hypothetical protein